MRYEITPIGKPRMTRQDKWKRRPPVVRYMAYAKKLWLLKVEIPPIPKIVFYLPMPASWSEKKRKAFDGAPHLAQPDKDNLEKALYDALFDKDSHIWVRLGGKALGAHRGHRNYRVGAGAMLVRVSKTTGLNP